MRPSQIYAALLHAISLATPEFAPEIRVDDGFEKFKQENDYGGLSKEAQVELLDKFIHDRIEARLARLAPAFEALGLRCVHAAVFLKEFLDYEDRAAEVALSELIAMLRRRHHGGASLWKEMDALTCDALTLIADMLDPDKPGPWKLVLKRAAAGAPSDKHGSNYHWIATEYLKLLEEFKEQGVRSPAKEATRRLIKDEHVSENDIRRSLQWWRKKGPEFER